MNVELDCGTLTDEHGQSSYGQPVLLINGEEYRPGDLLPDGRLASMAVWEETSIQDVAGVAESTLVARFVSHPLTIG